MGFYEHEIYLYQLQCVSHYTITNIQCNSFLLAWQGMNQTMKTLNFNHMRFERHKRGVKMYMAQVEIDLFRMFEQSHRLAYFLYIFIL